jgi:methionyl-tRNA formyltransferase
MTERVAIGADDTTGDLHDRLKAICASLMVRALESLERRVPRLEPQSAEGVTYARKVDKAETRVDWTLSAAEVHNRIRGLSPSPGAWCEVAMAGRSERLKLIRSKLAEGAGAPGEILDERLTIACGGGAVQLVEIQRAGGKPVTAAEFLRGAKLSPGERLS